MGPIHKLVGKSKPKKRWHHPCPKQVAEGCWSHREENPFFSGKDDDRNLACPECALLIHEAEMDMQTTKIIYRRNGTILIADQGKSVDLWQIKNGNVYPPLRLRALDDALADSLVANRKKTNTLTVKRDRDQKARTGNRPRKRKSQESSQQSSSQELSQQSSQQSSRVSSQFLENLKDDLDMEAAKKEYLKMLLLVGKGGFVGMYGGKGKLKEKQIGSMTTYHIANDEHLRNQTQSRRNPILLNAEGRNLSTTNFKHDANALVPMVCLESHTRNQSDAYTKEAAAVQIIQQLQTEYGGVESQIVCFNERTDLDSNGHLAGTAGHCNGNNPVIDDPNSPGVGFLVMFGIQRHKLDGREIYLNANRSQDYKDKFNEQLHGIIRYESYQIPLNEAIVEAKKKGNKMNVVVYTQRGSTRTINLQ